ncbi:unnamed protein product [Effrenium voratum]|uniref:WW domain-containing protein n=1 Tax=Effrenium voratum TaxID=2562239 RepID=A0AA36HKX6_9DINO|nr:unnamed protein product [Effrenium voratum]
MDLDKERHLLWIARDGVAAPVPHPWKTCTEKGEVFYFNFETEESSWDHPSDSRFRALLEEHRSKAQEDKDQSEKDADGGGADADGDASFVSSMVASSEGDMEPPPKEPSEGSPWSATSTPRSESGVQQTYARLNVTDAQRAMGMSKVKNQEGEASMELQSVDSRDFRSDNETPVNDRADSPASAGHGGQRLRVGLAEGNQGHGASNMSEVSEDFHSDWGAPSPLGSSGPGGPAAAPHSLEVSASDVSVSGALPVCRIKSWSFLQEELTNLTQALRATQKLREEQAACLRRFKGEVQ